MEIKALRQLSQVGAATGDYKSAFTYLNRYSIEKDSVFETEKTKTVFELETKYETQKKEKEILTQRADLAEKELDISKKNNYSSKLIKSSSSSSPSHLEVFIGAKIAEVAI